MIRPFLLFAVAATALAADRFDVASIKPNPADIRPRLDHLPGGRFQATAANLAILVRHAYGVEDIQVSGAEGWMSSERFDILAKTEDPPPKIAVEQRQKMLQALLAERFQLKIRKESKEMPVFALVVSKSGAKLKPVGGERTRITPAPGATGGVLYAASVQALCSALTGVGGKLVIDRTGLSGEYDIALPYTVEFVNGAMRREDLAPAMFAAVQEHLGLKVESKRAPVEMIVIESAERPTGN